MRGNSISVGEEHLTPDSPSFTGEEMMRSLAVGGALMVLTVIGMLIIADTFIAELILGLFNTLLILGVIVIGLGLSAGKYFGLKGVKSDNIGMALFGSSLCVATYSLMGGAILTPYSSVFYIPALLITSLITISLSLAAGFYVYRTNKNLEYWSKYSMYCFLGGLLLAVVGSFSAIFAIGAFVLFLAGFLCDLVYQIWMTSHTRRSPVANGLALYIAFAGVFIHILQLVLRTLARR